MIKLKDILIEAIDKKLPKVFYHITPFKNLDNIKRNGLQVPTHRLGIYLTDDKFTAENYANMYPNDDMVLLKIDSNGIDKKYLYPDDYELVDYLRDNDIEEYDKWSDVSWELSLKWVNQVQYSKPINIKYIKVVKILDEKIIKEGFEKETYEMVLKQPLGTILPEESIYLYVQWLNWNYYDETFVDGDLGDRIEDYEKYKLQLVPLSKIDLEEFDLHQHTVDEYKEIYEKTKTYSPIVLDNRYSIIDGNHRANALEQLGEKEILAWVGIK